MSVATTTTSAFLKVVISEPGSGTVAQAWTGATSVVAGRLLYPEARAALAAALRAGRVPPRSCPGLRARIDELWENLRSSS